LVSNRFLEINGVYKKPSRPSTPRPAAPTYSPPRPTNVVYTPPPPATPPRPRVTASASFLRANGVAAPLNSLATGVGTTPALPATPVVTQASAQTPAPFRPSNHFLQVNGAYNPPAAAQPQAPLNDVDQAAEDLEAALDQQRSVDPFARRFLQGQVNAARDELDGAIRDEIDATQTRAPYFVPVTLDDKRQTGADIEERHAENDAISLEVDRAVGRVIVDVEVDDTVDLVTRAPNADRGYGLLAGRLDDVSDKARLRLLQHDEIGAVIDEVVDVATEPLGGVGTADWPMTDVAISVQNIRDLTDRAGHADLAAEVVLRAQPALDQAVEDKDGTSRGRAEPILSWDARMNLGVISDAMIGSREAEDANEGLARFVIGGSEGVVRQGDLVQWHYEGTGVALDVAVIQQAEADPYLDAAPLVETAIANYEGYIEHTVGGAIEDYSDHAGELNYYIANFPGTQEELRTAIDEYVGNQRDDWAADHQANFDRLAAHGMNVFRQQEMLGAVTHLTQDGDEKLSEAASQAAFETSGNFFLNSGLVATSGVDLDAAIGFVGTLKLAKGTAALSRSIANTHIQEGLRGALSGLDRNDPASLRNGANALRTISSERVARALGTDPEDLAAGMDALAGMLDDGRTPPGELVTRIDSFEDEIKKLDTLPANSPVGFAIRSAGVVLGGITTYGSVEDFLKDPSLGTAFSASVDGTGLAQTLAATGTDFLNAADDANAVTRFGSNRALQRYLGGAGLALSVPGIYNNLADGDYIQAGLGGLSLGGGTVAWFAARGTVFGPKGAVVGTAIGTVAGVLSMGYGHLQRVGASNDYVDEAARDFFSHAGLDNDATRALADRSGEGFSPIPILMAYAAEHGLTQEESIAWLNSLDKDELDTMRDAFHRTLDKTDGDIDAFINAASGGQDELDALERRGRRNPHFVGTPTNLSTADYILEQQNIPLPA